MQIQADLGEGHVNVVQAKEALLTDNHLALVMEYAACGSLTNYVTDRWQNAQTSGFFLAEDEARYFFRVSRCLLKGTASLMRRFIISAIFCTIYYLHCG